MRLIRWMIVAMAMAGGVIGLSATANAAPLPNSASLTAEAGASQASPAQFFIYRRRPFYGYRRRYYGYRPYYRPYYGYRPRYYGYRPIYRPYYGYRRRYF